MNKKTVTVFRGDGIGPEITNVVLDILKASGAPVTFEVFDVGMAQLETKGKLIPDEGFASFDRTHVLLKSPITTPIGKGFRSLNVMLRLKYELFANIRPAKYNDAVPTPFKGVDIVTFRENTEDLYTGTEEKVDEDTYHATKIITRKATNRIIHAAFDYAREHGRKRVSCIHKANILKVTDGFFLDRFREIAKEYPEIEANDMIVDNACMKMVMNPYIFDVLVTPNLYGDILSDLTSGLIGGLGLMPSCNMGKDHAMFEAVHGSAPDIAGKHIANPTALLLSACMMLDHIEMKEYAAKIREATNQVLAEAKYLTPDLGGSSKTEEYRDAILAKLAAMD